MRIAIANWTVRHAGGAESYIELASSGLCRAGHELAYLYELDQPANRRPLELSADVPLWCASRIGVEAALAGLRRWRPDVVYAHHCEDAALERGIVAAAPAVFFAHDYRGVCVSGDKMFKLPRHEPCARAFGWSCLVAYFPRHCGGRSPISMMRMFHKQTGRLAVLRSYDFILTASEHMRREYLKHGFAAENVRLVVPPIDARGEFSQADCTLHPTAGWRLVFAGRMTHLKGGAILLDALPHVSAALDAPVSLTFVGDGVARPEWEARARALMARNPDLHVEFTGWMAGAEFDTVVTRSHLHVMPSVWPEPFGLSGPELGARGMPSAAFAVGGIPEWLRDGVNGFVAPADPPTAEGLADAIVRCLADEATYRRLRMGAIESARRFGLERHVNELGRVFEDAVDARAASHSTA